MGYYLDPINATWFTAQSLTAVIYWRKKGGVDALQNGHAALIIDSKQFEPFSSEYYVSWLAQPGGNLFKKRGASSTFYVDMADWGGMENPLNKVQMEGRCYPTRWVVVSGLNVSAMKQAWDAVRGKQNAHWTLTSKNCATVVARVLKAGGGDNHAARARQQTVWWPTDLITYARSMGNAVVKDSNDPPVNAGGG